MPITAALIGGSVLAPIVGGAIGNAMAGDDQDAAKAAQLRALQAYSGISLPDIQRMQVDPTLQRVQGSVNPLLQSTVQENSNAMQSIKTDPRLMQAQLSALSQLQSQGQGGLTAGERAALQTIANQVGGANAASNKAILANMAARGIGGSGIELAAQQSANQQATNLAAQQAASMASQSQQNALQAMMGAGQMGAQMQGQQFSQDAAKAQAQNAINQFNAANRQNVMAQNTGAQNQAQYFNQQNAQQVANANVGAQNQSKYYNSNLQQQQYEDALRRAQGIAGGEQNMGNYYSGQAQATRGMYSGMGNAVGSALGAGATYQAGAPVRNAQTNYYNAAANSMNGGGLAGVDFNSLPKTKIIDGYGNT